MNGNKQMNAIKYLNPAKIKGGISFNPNFIITKEVDHRKVTSRAIKTAAVLEILKSRIIYSILFI